MSVLAGILRTEDLTPIVDIPVVDLTTAVNDLLARYVAERNEATRLFVQEVTTARTERVRSGGVDEGQELGPDGRPLETRPAGEIEVAYPWIRFGWAFGGNSETAAAMTVADTDRSVASITGGNARRHMREINRAVWNNANYAHPDADGTITIRRLANGDGTLYAPAINADAEADDNHYLVSGYASTAMSATNNPFTTLASEIREHFDSTQAVVAFINTAQRNDVLTLLPNFVDADVEGITRASTEASAAALDGVDVPGDFLGVDGDSGVYVYVWDRTPGGYISAFAVGQPAPLKQRIPRLVTLQGFKLEAEEEHNPMWKRTYRDRFGYGVANRLTAAVMQLVATGPYVVPAIYA
jgi:hypothetical protein